MADEPNFSSFSAQMAEASSALSAFARGEGQRAADDLSEAFERAGVRIARALARAGADGEVSFRQLAKNVLEIFAQLALDRLLGGASSAPSAASFAPVTVNFNVSGGDPSAVLRHQGQVAAGVARAVAYGKRNL